MADGIDRRHVKQAQFGIEKADVKCRVVNDQLGTADKVEKLGSDVGEVRLVLQKLATDAVHRLRTGINFTLGVEVAVKVVIGQAPVAHLDAGDFDDAVPEFVLKAGGFGVEKNLAHSGLSFAGV